MNSNTRAIPGAGGVKAKAAITWVSVASGVSAEVPFGSALYDRLFSDPNPDAGGKGSSNNNLDKDGRTGGMRCKALGPPHSSAMQESSNAAARQPLRTDCSSYCCLTPRDFIEALNPDSLKVVTAYVEPSLAAANPDQKFQFERFGYFVADRVDHVAGVSRCSIG